MVDTFANPSYASPFAGSLDGLAKAFMTGPSEAQKIAQAEQALKMQTQRIGTQGVADAFLNYGKPGFDRNAVMSAAVRGGYAPDNLAHLERYGAANTFGATDPRTTNATVGAGGAYSSTAAGFRENEAGQMSRHASTLAEQQRQFDNKPFTVGGPTGPLISTQRDAIGMPAVEDLGKVKGDYARRAINAPGGLDGLSTTGQQFIGANTTPKSQPTPRNYAVNGQNLVTYDGVTEAATGRPLPPGGAIVNPQGSASDVGLRPNVTGDLQKGNIANQKFKTLLGMTRESAAESPMNFGVTGFVKGTLQDVGQLGQNVATGLGYTGIEEALQQTRQKAMASGVDPSLVMGFFDPNLPKLHTLADLLVYSAAEALAGQTGRSVSNEDIKRLKAAVGDPQSWMMSQTAYMSKLDTLGSIVDAYQAVNDQQLRRTASPQAATQAAPGAAPPPSAAPGAPLAVKRFERGPDGTLQRVQ